MRSSYRNLLRLSTCTLLLAAACDAIDRPLPDAAPAPPRDVASDSHAIPDAPADVSEGSEPAWPFDGSDPACPPCPAELPVPWVDCAGTAVFRAVVVGGESTCVVDPPPITSTTYLATAVRIVAVEHDCASPTPPSLTIHEVVSVEHLGPLGFRPPMEVRLTCSMNYSCRDSPDMAGLIGGTIECGLARGSCCARCWALDAELLGGPYDGGVSSHDAEAGGP